MCSWAVGLLKSSHAHACPEKARKHSQELLDLAHSIPPLLLLQLFHLG